jgi:hypothetical protein
MCLALKKLFLLRLRSNITVYTVPESIDRKYDFQLTVQFAMVLTI